MTHKCPVCGYDKLVHPPKDHFICPCCGTEFGYDDAVVKPAVLRAEWIENGCLWFSSFTLPPLGWNPITQLLRAGFAYKARSDAFAVTTKYKRAQVLDAQAFLFTSGHLSYPDEQPKYRTNGPVLDLVPV